MKIAVIGLCNRGAQIGRHLVRKLPEARLFVHEKIDGFQKAERFSKVLELTNELFDKYEGLVFVAPCGVAVRAIAPNLKHKKSDPAVVVVDVGGRYAVSLLSGHEGGANNLSLIVGNLLGAEPIISTTTEAEKTVIVGIGCRRGIGAQVIIQAIETVLREVNISLNEVRLLASIDIKMGEPGLLEAARSLKIPLRFIAAEEVRQSPKCFNRSAWVERSVNLPAVAEPAALLAGRRTKLIFPRKAMAGVTIALAQESFLWSASDREASSTERAAPKTRSRKVR